MTVFSAYKIEVDFKIFSDEEEQERKSGRKEVRRFWARSEVGIDFPFLGFAVG